MPTNEELTARMLVDFRRLLENGKIRIPNRSGGANGPEIIAKIDAAIGTDWKSGTGAEILAVVEAADPLTLPSLAVTGDLDMTGDLLVATKTPSAANDTGTAGTIAWDGSYLYVCSATDTWLRIGIATW
jgi:hypothetical protein